MITPEQAVDAANERFGVHPGRRAFHAKGLFTSGSFTATPEAARLTKAAHMQGQRVKVTVRFSNGSGDPANPDYQPGVRGMATTFHLPDGSRTDLSAQTVPRLPVNTAEDFITLVQLGAPGWLNKGRLLLFLATHPMTLIPARAAETVMAKLPASYSTCRYYAVHAFKWIDPGGTGRYVRYYWIPEAGEVSISPTEAQNRGADYLAQEIGERLAREPVRFALHVQLAAPGDPVDDPRAVWPTERETVVAGTLELTSLAVGETGGEVIVFDPMRLTDGIEPSDDPILHFRSPAYAVSAQRRGAFHKVVKG
jgi:catalase